MCVVYDDFDGFKKVFLKSENQSHSTHYRGHFRTGAMGARHPKNFEIYIGTRKVSIFTT